jgi:hypothetical protein
MGKSIISTNNKAFGSLQNKTFYNTLKIKRRKKNEIINLINLSYNIDFTFGFG